MRSATPLAPLFNFQMRVVSRLCGPYPAGFLLWSGVCAYVFVCMHAFVRVHVFVYVCVHVE